MGSKINQIPAGWTEFAALEARLNAGDLTINELQDIQDQIVLKTTEKTHKLVSGLFDKIEAKKDSFTNREAAVSEEVCDLAKKIGQLEIRWNQMVPSQIADELVSLNERATRISGEREISPWIHEINRAAQEQLEHLNFAFVFPQVIELKRETMEPTFASRLHKIAEQIRQQDNVLPFKALDSYLQREIVRYVSGEGV